MAIIAQWSGDGLTDGTAVTTATAGTGDDPFDAVTSGAFTVDASGLRSPRIRMDQAAGTDAQLTWSNTITGSLTAYSLRAYVELTGYPPSSGSRLVDPRDNLNVLLWYVDVHNSGVIRLKDVGGVAVDTTASAVPLNTKLRIECVADGGNVSVYVYQGNSTTPLETLTGSGLGATFQQVRWGEPGTSPTLPTAYFDEMAVSDQAVLIGPAESTVPAESGTGTAVVTVAATGTGFKSTAGSGAAAVTVSTGGTGSKAAAGTGAAEVAVTASGAGRAFAVQPRFPLDDRYELLLDGEWTDITRWVYDRDPVSISLGRSAEAQTADPCKMSLTLDNRDGRFASRNPMGAWYGILGRNTRIRASLPYGSGYMRLAAGDDTGKATCPGGAALAVGDLDVRIDVDAGQWWAGDLAGRYVTTGDQRSWWFGVETGVPELIWSPDGTSAARLFAVGPEVLPVERGRLAVRATLDVDNGSGGWTVVFYTADTIDGPWAQLGDPITGTGATSVYDGTADLELGAVDNLGIADTTADAVPGHWLAFELYDGIDGTLAAGADFTTLAAGTTSFTDAAGNVWTLGAGAVIDDRRYRFHGEVSKWPATYALGGVDDYVKIRAFGIKRRLTQNAPVLGSPMRREYTNPDRQHIVAYWPLEDGKEATQAASGLPGVAPAQIAGDPDMGSYDEWTATDPVPTMKTGAIVAAVPPYPATERVSVRAFVFMPGGAVTAETSLLRVETTGTAATWEIRILPNGSLRVKAWDSSGTPIDDGPFVSYQDGALDGEWQTNMDGRGFTVLNLELIKGDDAGAPLVWRAQVIDFGNTDTIDQSSVLINYFTGGLPGYTVGAARSVILGAERGLGEVKVGHLVVADQISGTDIIAWGGLTAWNGENTLARLLRLCREEQIQFTYTSGGRVGNDVDMGDQLNKPLVELLQQCADSDVGVLYEPRDHLGFAYRTRLSLYNQPAAVTLDWSKGQIAGDLVPVDDDQAVRNDITVERVAGSSVRVQQTTGPVSVQPPPDGVGRYDAKVDLSLEDDAQLVDQAGWRLHLGTVDEARYPTLSVNLRAPGLTDEQIENILAIDVGDRIDLTGLPTHDDVGLIVQGYSETLRLMRHEITFNCAPASPWEIAIAGLGSTARIDASASRLDADATSTATTLPVASDGPGWAADPDALPYDVFVAGERVTVTAVADRALNANPYFETDLTGWTPLNVTIARSTTVVHEGGTASMQITPDGTAAACGAGSELVPVTPGGAYTAQMWANSPSGYDAVRVLVNWHDADGVFISSSLGALTGLTAGAWTRLREVFTAPDGAAQAAVWAWQASSPATSGVWYAWAVWLTPAGSTLQTLTVTRSVNGVTKPQTAGAEVRIPDPVYVAL